MENNSTQTFAEESVTTLATTLEVEQVQCDYEQVESWQVPVSSAAKKCSTSSSPEDSRQTGAAPAHTITIGNVEDAFWALGMIQRGVMDYSSQVAVQNAIKRFINSQDQDLVRFRQQKFTAERRLRDGAAQNDTLRLN